MAADWIKMRTNLWTDPRVVRIVSALNVDRATAIGALFRLWSLADEHSETGFLPGYDLKLIDREVGIEGFAAAVRDVGWLRVRAQGIILPNFEEHNGYSAKRRAQDSSRKKGVRKVSASRADKKRTREEKRREEKKQPPISPVGFDKFWKTYPGDRKRAKPQCRKKWIALGLEKKADEVIEGLGRWLVSKEWVKDGGKFIPAPLVWLNQQNFNEHPSRADVAGGEPPDPGQQQKEREAHAAEQEEIAKDRQAMIDWFNSQPKEWVQEQTDADKARGPSTPGTTMARCWLEHQKGQ